MPSSNPTSLDELISHIVAGLHASQSLRMVEIEKLLQMSLLLLGQSIAQPKTRKQKSQTTASGNVRAKGGGDQKVKKPRTQKTPQQESAAPATRELSLVIDSNRETSDTMAAQRSEMAVFQHRPGHSTSPRRRPTTRRTGSRG